MQHAGILKEAEATEEANMRSIMMGLALAALALPLLAVTRSSTAEPVELRVDDLKTPLGIDNISPHFSWQLKDPARGAKQTAYQIQVASRAELLATVSGKADLWDSGRIESDKSLNVHYAGPSLLPSTRYFWRVKLWDVSGKPYPASPVTWWETGQIGRASCRERV